MKQSPNNISTEIIRDHHGSFIIEKTEIDRLLSDIKHLLRQGDTDQAIKITYWVGLKNGIIYETDDLDSVFNEEENAQSLTIVLLLIIAERINKEQGNVRRIIVHFSRGKPQQAEDRLKLSDGQWFSFNFQGISYRITETNRKSALETIAALEERLNKFRRFVGFKIISVNWRILSINLLFSLVFGILLYASSSITKAIGSSTDSSLAYTSNFLGYAAQGIFALVIMLVLTVAVYSALDWLLSPSVILIGDEVKTYKRDQIIRQGIFWTVIIGGIVSFVVNMLTNNLPMLTNNIPVR